MTVVDDATLVQLAADPPEPLLPVLDRTRAFRPLIGVLAILPCLVALERRGLDDAGALWALEAQKVFSVMGVPADSPQQNSPLHDQVPLFLWLLGGILRVGDDMPLVAPLIVSLLPTMGCIWWGYRFFAGAGEERLGLWVAIWFSFQGTTLLLATSVSPTPLLLLLSLICWDAWQRHCRQQESFLSLWVLLCGLFLGVSLLVGGAAAGGIVAGLALSSLLSQARLFSRAAASSGRSYGRPGRELAGFVVVLATAFATGGWWLMQLAARDNPPDWAAWWTGYDALLLRRLSGGKTPIANFSGTDVLLRGVFVLGPLLPLMLYGAWRAALRFFSRNSVLPREGARGEEQWRKRPVWHPEIAVRWLLALLLAGLLGGLLVPGLAAAPVTYRTFAGSVFIFAATGCAALCIEENLLRIMAMPVALLLSLFMLVLLPVVPLWVRSNGPPEQFWPLLVEMAVLLPLGALGIAALWYWSRGREHRRKIVLLTNLIIQLGLVFAGGVMEAVPQSNEERRLDRFCRELSEHPAPAVVLLISDQPPNPRLEYALRSLNPRALWRQSRRWSDVRLPADGLSKSRRSLLVVEWTSPGRPLLRTFPAELRNVEMKPAATPQFYRQRELRAFHLHLPAVSPPRQQGGETGGRKP